MNEELYPLYETALKNIRERPLTFQEVQRMTIEVCPKESFKKF